MPFASKPGRTLKNPYVPSSCCRVSMRTPSLPNWRLDIGLPRILQGYEAQIVAEILKVAEQEIENNPTQLLTLDRGKAAALIDGAVDRSEVYQRAQAKVYELINKVALEANMRAIRKAEIGEESAEEEDRKSVV